MGEIDELSNVLICNPSLGRRWNAPTPVLVNIKTHSARVAVVVVVDLVLHLDTKLREQCHSVVLVKVGK